MDSEDPKKENNFQNFFKLQKDMDSFAMDMNFHTYSLQLDEMFRMSFDHFEELYRKENLPLILAFIHRCIKAWINRGDYKEDDIGFFLVNLLADHCNDENEINVVLQIIYQMMHSVQVFGNKDVIISEKLLRELITTVPLIKSRTVASSCIACIRKYLVIYPEGLKSLTILWQNLKHHMDINLKNGMTKEIDIDILMEFFDDFQRIDCKFYEEPIVIGTTQRLLRSEQRKLRKCGHFLLKKLFQYFNENVNAVARMWISTDHNQGIERSWVTYIGILGNLEEEQSHLILPLLENVENLIKSNHITQSWLTILYLRILNHRNHLVLRWSVEFFLRMFSSSDLPKDVLKTLLRATNSNLLFNYEGYFLTMDYFSSFLKGDVTNLLALFCEIENWKSIPLYIWLENLGKTQLSKPLTLEQILRISSCVRKIQNYNIRQLALVECQQLFTPFIKNMSMKEYVTYIEASYNPSDKYLDHDEFYSKKLSIIQSQEDSIFTQRFFDIFTNYSWFNADLFLFLNDIPTEQHGWLKFAPFKFKLTYSERSYIKKFYKLDLDLCAACELEKVASMFKNCLLDSPPYDKNELFECNQAAISFYVNEGHHSDVEDEDTLRFILNCGIKHGAVVDTFAEKLLKHREQRIDMWFIDELLKYNRETMLKTVSTYICRVCDDIEIKKYAIKIWKKCNFELCLFQNINLVEDLTKEWFNRLSSQGDERIEEAFLYKHLRPKKLYVLHRSLQQIEHHYEDEQIIVYLLKYHTDITRRKPRYFENSYEHRVKLRIAACIFHYSHFADLSEHLDQIWNILLNENNQLNIIYLYENILGRKENRNITIINKLKQAQNFTPSQQVSIITVVYMYCRNMYIDEETKNTIIRSLLTLSMGANFQTRLFAQMSLYKLLRDEFAQPGYHQELLISIKEAVGTKLEEYLSDIRLNDDLYSIETIFYITNVPFDECYKTINDLNLSEPEKIRIESCRQKFLNKFKVTKNENTTLNIAIHDQFQRKLHPVNDLTEPHNLFTFPIEDKPAKMFVVASLIDKVPNLGGIARTCEVLGIRNLVMNSKKHTEKSDFKNLSMTAEQGLNLLEVKPEDLKEFLTCKKLEGYNIVGAEQTSRSQNFKEFKFPEKCVLLLGHEKDGIPPLLLGLLDAVVEIPQFGQVRSLNVHVTAALFMWEYCKQHIIPNDYLTNFGR